jgi:hypothetical protein
MMRFNTIIIANIAEAFENVISKVQSVEQRVARVDIEHSLCDRTFLWEGDDKIVVTPFPIAELIFKKNMEVFSFKNVINLSPKNINVSLSDAIQEDKELLKTLIDIIRNNPGIAISPYCVTEKFLSFIKFLEQHGLTVCIKEIPKCEKPHQMVSYLDSKVGSRMEIGKIKHHSVNIPESVACGTVAEVTDALTLFYNSGKSCAVKANFGESGWGLLLIVKEKFQSLDDIIRYVLSEFEKDSIWRDEIILVEEYIESDGSYGRSPSSELFIDDRESKITYLCDQVLDINGSFLGVALGMNVLDEKTKKYIETASIHIGKKFFEIGYRGFFDIDFVVAKDGTPIVIETNMRRTGGTHVYDAVRSLIGKNWASEAFVLSQDSFNYGQKRLSAKEILGKMENILYPINSQKRGVVVSIVNKNQPTFGFIIVGNSREDAIEIYNQMTGCWR